LPEREIHVRRKKRKEKQRSVTDVPCSKEGKKINKKKGGGGENEKERGGEERLRAKRKKWEGATAKQLVWRKKSTKGIRGKKRNGGKRGD